MAYRFAASWMTFSDIRSHFTCWYVV